MHRPATDCRCLHANRSQLAGHISKHAECEHPSLTSGDVQDVNGKLESYDAQNIDMPLAISLEERGSQSLHAPLDRSSASR